MEAPPSPHSSAVSGLLQQLKSGEISKMQLFQQIAKLQVASSIANAGSASTVTTTTASSPPVPPAMHSMMSTMPTTPPAAPVFLSTATLGARAPTPQSQPPQSYVSFTFPASPAVAPFPPQQSTQQQPHLSMMMNPTCASAPATSAPFEQCDPAEPPSRAFFSDSSHHPVGATKVEGDADFLASGVSHEKAQRFSVQEWMASKYRSSNSFMPSQPNSGHATTRHQQQMNQYQPNAYYQYGDALNTTTTMTTQLFSHPQEYQKDEFSDDVNGIASQIRMLDLQRDGNGVGSGRQEDNRYEYTPQRQFDYHQHHGNALAAQESSGGAESNDQEYLDFTEHFRDELNASNGGAGGNTNGENPNGKGNNPTTSSSGNDDAKFHARVTRWKSQKDAIREQMKQQLLQSELDECTFAPKVNPKSTKVAAKLRSRHKNSKEASSPFAVSERLYQEADNYKAREELAQRVKAEEEADLERECTFKPKINRNNSLTEKVKAKYMDTQKTPSPSFTAAAMESTAKELEQCTFYPKVNPVGPEMVSAQLYLQQDIYERLSRPCCMANDNSPVKTRHRRRRGSLTDDDDDDDDDDDVGDADNEMTSFMLASPRGTRRSQDDLYIRSLSPRRHRSSGTASGRRHHHRSGHQQRPHSAGGIHTDDDKEERARQLDNFLERQHFHEEARRKKIETTKQQLLPAHKPTINKKSLDMMENGRKGDFLERITKYALRKEHDNVKKKSVRAADPNCTFKPSINQTSTKRKARSVTELSRGDLLRRETTQRLMKLKMEQEEMAALTFRPQLNRVSDRHEGKLKILTSPDTYLQRIQQQSQAHTIKQRRAVQEKELEEFAECTFKPRTIEAPAYIQRIARSVSLTKALKQQQQLAAKAGEKPEWK